MLEVEPTNREGAAAIANALRSNTTITELALGDSGVLDEGILAAVNGTLRVNKFITTIGNGAAPPPSTNGTPAAGGNGGDEAGVAASASAAHFAASTGVAGGGVPPSVEATPMAKGAPMAKSPSVPEMGRRPSLGAALGLGASMASPRRRAARGAASWAAAGGRGPAAVAALGRPRAATVRWSPALSSAV